MILLDDYLANLVRNGSITREAALEKAANKTEMLSAIGRL